MSKTLNQKRWLVLLISLLVLSILNISPTMGIDTDYEVNPDYYTTNLDPGDSRTYVFDRIRIQDNVNEFEKRELILNVTIAGEDVELIVAEGSKVTVDIISVNNTYIKTKHKWQLINGSVFYSDNMLTNKSTLDVVDDNGDIQVIFTTNDTLIKEVYSATSWDLELDPDRVRISNRSWNGPEGYEEEYEYDLKTGFLMQFRIRNEGEGHRSEVELRETEVWNTDWFELGVAVGATNTYILNTITMYDHHDGSYRHESHIFVVLDGNPQYITISEGDEIIVEVISTDGDYIELQLTFLLVKDGTKVTDEYPYLIDKSTFWAPRDLGVPLMLTINRTFWKQAPPGDVEIVDDVVKFHEEHKDPYSGNSDVMEGSWNLTTGWMLRFYNQRIENQDGKEIIQHEMEIIDADLVEPEPTNIIGVEEGDSKYYEFTDILMPEDNSSLIGGPGSSGDQLVISYGGDNGGDKQVTIQPDDTAKIVVEDIQEPEIDVTIIFNSAIDGIVDIGTMTINFKEHTYSYESGPIFIVPIDEQMIREIFQGDYDDDGVKDANFTFSTETVVILISSSDGEKDYEDEFTYDLKTGWITKYSHTVEEDDVVIEKLIFVETTDIQDFSDTQDTKDTKADDNVDLTPIPLFPVMVSLLLAAGIPRKRRR